VFSLLKRCPDLSLGYTMTQRDITFIGLIFILVATAVILFLWGFS
jgi:hypothetical protein